MNFLSFLVKFMQRFAPPAGTPPLFFSATCRFVVHALRAAMPVWGGTTGARRNTLPACPLAPGRSGALSCASQRMLDDGSIVSVTKWAIVPFARRLPLAMLTVSPGSAPPSVSDLPIARSRRDHLFVGGVAAPTPSAGRLAVLDHRSRVVKPHHPARFTDGEADIA